MILKMSIFLVPRDVHLRLCMAENISNDKKRQKKIELEQYFIL